MQKRIYSTILIIAALFIFSGTSKSQSVEFGLSYHSPNLAVHLGTNRPHPYYYPGYVYHRPVFHRVYYPQRYFYHERVYRHDRGYHKGWYKRHKRHGKHKW